MMLGNLDNGVIFKKAFTNKMVFKAFESTPQAIRDWLDLIYQSFIHNPQRPALNFKNKGIKKAVELISFENLTREERTLAKNKETNKINIAKYRRLEAIDIAKNAIRKSYDNAVIVDITNFSLERIEKLSLEVAEE